MTPLIRPVFRWRAIAAIAAAAGLLTVAGLGLASGYLEATTASRELAARDATIQLRESQLSRSQGQLKQKEADLAQIQAKLDGATKDLAAKLADLKTAQRKIESQEAQISANSGELAKLRLRPPLFSFRVSNGNLTDSEVKKASVKQVVTDAYDAITAIYGQPYLLHEIVIDFVDRFSNPSAAAETQITNGKDGLSVTIRLKDFDRNSFTNVNSLIHELIHTFHGLATFEPIAYEEGIAVATADAVMTELITQGKIPSFKPLYVRLSGDDYAATTLRLPADDDSFYTSPDVGRYYQIAGYGWLRLYQARKDVFKTVNESIYSSKRQGAGISGDLVRDAVARAIDQVYGQPIAGWLTTKAFALAG